MSIGTNLEARTSVFGNILVSELEGASPQRLVVPHTRRGCEESGPNQLLGFGMPTLTDEMPKSWKIPVCITGRTILWPAIPNRVLVQLEEFGTCAAMDHATQAAVANRQGLGPLFGWLVVVEV